MHGQKTGFMMPDVPTDPAAAPAAAPDTSNDPGTLSSLGQTALGVLGKTAGAAAQGVSDMTLGAAAGFLDMIGQDNASAEVSKFKSGLENSDAANAYGDAMDALVNNTAAQQAAKAQHDQLMSDGYGIKDFLGDVTGQNPGGGRFLITEGIPMVAGSFLAGGAAGKGLSVLANSSKAVSAGALKLAGGDAKLAKTLTGAVTSGMSYGTMVAGGTHSDVITNIALSEAAKEAGVLPSEYVQQRGDNWQRDVADYFNKLSPEQRDKAVTAASVAGLTTALLSGLQVKVGGVEGLMAGTETKLNKLSTHAKGIGMEMADEYVSQMATREGTKAATGDYAPGQEEFGGNVLMAGLGEGAMSAGGALISRSKQAPDNTQAPSGTGQIDPSVVETSNAGIPPGDAPQGGSGAPSFVVDTLSAANLNSTAVDEDGEPIDHAKIMHDAATARVAKRVGDLGLENTDSLKSIGGIYRELQAAYNRSLMQAYPDMGAEQRKQLSMQMAKDHTDTVADENGVGYLKNSVAVARWKAQDNHAGALKDTINRAMNAGRGYDSTQSQSGQPVSQRDRNLTVMTEMANTANQNHGIPAPADMTNYDGMVEHTAMLAAMSAVASKNGASLETLLQTVKGTLGALLSNDMSNGTTPMQAGANWDQQMSAAALAGIVGAAAIDSDVSSVGSALAPTINIINKTSKAIPKVISDAERSVSGSTDVTADDFDVAVEQEVNLQLGALFDNARGGIRDALNTAIANQSALDFVSRDDVDKASAVATDFVIRKMESAGYGEATDMLDHARRVAHEAQQEAQAKEAAQQQRQAEKEARDAAKQAEAAAKAQARAEVLAQKEATRAQAKADEAATKAQAEAPVGPPPVDPQQAKAAVANARKEADAKAKKLTEAQKAATKSADTVVALAGKLEGLATGTNTASFVSTKAAMDEALRKMNNAVADMEAAHKATIKADAAFVEMATQLDPTQVPTTPRDISLEAIQRDAEHTRDVYNKASKLKKPTKPDALANKKAPAKKETAKKETAKKETAKKETAPKKKPLANKKPDPDKDGDAKNDGDGDGDGPKPTSPSGGGRSASKKKSLTNKKSDTSATAKTSPLANKPKAAASPIVKTDTEAVKAAASRVSANPLASLGAPRTASKKKAAPTAPPETKAPASREAEVAATKEEVLKTRQAINAKMKELSAKAQEAADAAAKEAEATKSKSLKYPTTRAAYTKAIKAIDDRWTNVDPATLEGTERDAYVADRMNRVQMDTILSMKSKEISTSKMTNEQRDILAQALMAEAARLALVLKADADVSAYMETRGDDKFLRASNKDQKTYMDVFVGTMKSVAAAVKRAFDPRSHKAYIRAAVGKALGDYAQFIDFADGPAPTDTTGMMPSVPKGKRAQFDKMLAALETVRDKRDAARLATPQTIKLLVLMYEAAGVNINYAAVIKSESPVATFLGIVADQLQGLQHRAYAKRINSLMKKPTLAPSERAMFFTVGDRVIDVTGMTTNARRRISPVSDYAELVQIIAAHAKPSRSISRWGRNAETLRHNENAALTENVVYTLIGELSLGGVYYSNNEEFDFSDDTPVHNVDTQVLDAYVSTLGSMDEYGAEAEYIDMVNEAITNEWSLSGIVRSIHAMEAARDRGAAAYKAQQTHVHGDTTIYNLVGVENGTELFDASARALMQVSRSTWCTSHHEMSTVYTENDFIVAGTPAVSKVAVRFRSDGKVAEIQDERNTRMVGAEAQAHLDSVVAWMDANEDPRADAIRAYKNDKPFYFDEHTEEQRLADRAEAFGVTDYTNMTIDERFDALINADMHTVIDPNKIVVFGDETSVTVDASKFLPSEYNRVVAPNATSFTIGYSADPGATPSMPTLFDNLDAKSSYIVYTKEPLTSVTWGSGNSEHPIVINRVGFANIISEGASEIRAHTITKYMLASEGNYGTEALYDPDTGRATLYTDNIESTERAIFVAWHEMHHRGQDLFPELTNHLVEMADTPLMKKLLPQIKEQWGITDDATAVLEAAAELSAALRTRDDQFIKDRYGVGVNGSKIITWLKSLFDGLRKLFGAQHTDSDLLRIIRTIDKQQDFSVATEGDSAKRNGLRNKGKKASVSNRASATGFTGNEGRRFAQNHFNSLNGVRLFMPRIHEVIGKVVPAKYDLLSSVTTLPHRINTRINRAMASGFDPIRAAVRDFRGSNGLSGRMMDTLMEDYRKHVFYTRVVDRAAKYAAVHGALSDPDAVTQREDLLLEARAKGTSKARLKQIMREISALWAAHGDIEDASGYFGMSTSDAAAALKRLEASSPLVVKLAKTLNALMNEASATTHTAHMDAGVLGFSDVQMRTMYGFKDKGSTHWAHDNMNNLIQDNSTSIDPSVGIVDNALVDRSRRGVANFVHPLTSIQSDLVTSARRAEEAVTLRVLDNLTHDYGDKLGLEYAQRDALKPLYEVKDGSISFRAANVRNGELPVFIDGARRVIRATPGGGDKNMMNSLIASFQKRKMAGGLIRALSTWKDITTIGYTALNIPRYTLTAAGREILTPVASFLLRSNSVVGKKDGAMISLKVIGSMLSKWPVIAYAWKTEAERVKMAAQPGKAGDIARRIRRMADAGGYAELQHDTFINGLPRWMHEAVMGSNARDMTRPMGLAQSGVHAHLRQTGKMWDGFMRFVFAINHYATTLSALHTFETALENGASESLAAKETLSLYNPLLRGEGDTGALAAVIPFFRSFMSDIDKYQVEMFADEFGIPSKSLADPKVIMKITMLLAMGTAAGYLLAMMSAGAMGDDDDGVPFAQKLPPAPSVWRIYYGVNAKKEPQYIEMPFGAVSTAMSMGQASFRADMGWSDGKTHQTLVMSLMRNFSPVQLRSVEDVTNPTAIMGAVLGVHPGIAGMVSWYANDNGFGSNITPEGTPRTGYKHTSGFKSTGQGYVDAAKYVYDTTGVDMYPESIKWLATHTPILAPALNSGKGIMEGRVLPSEKGVAYFWNNRAEEAIDLARLYENRIKSNPTGYSPDIRMLVNQIKAGQTRKNSLAKALDNAQSADQKLSIENLSNGTIRTIAEAGMRLKTLTDQ